MTHVFISKDFPNRIKMIEAKNMENAYKNLYRRLLKEPKSGLPSDYKFGYYI